MAQVRPMSVSYVPRSLQSLVSITHRSYSQLTFFNIFTLKKMKNVSCEYDRLNVRNSTLQAAWYIRHVRYCFYIKTDYKKPNPTKFSAKNLTTLTIAFLGKNPPMLLIQYLV